MLSVMTGGLAPIRVPVKMWTDGLEEKAVTQIQNIANLPFTFHHVAIMPDCHSGYGMPIGGVLATKGVVIPNAVGVDIGCGMCAIKTSIKADRLDDATLRKVMGKIREVVPVGFAHQKVEQSDSLMPSKLYLLDEQDSPTPVCCAQY